MCTVKEVKVYCLEASRKCAVTVLSMARYTVLIGD